MNNHSGEITQQLTELENRREDAVPRLFELLYQDLRRIARRHFAYDRAHFFGVASGVMRRILVDHARAKRAQKRPDSRQKVVLEEPLAITGKNLESLIDIDRALSRLALLDVRQSRIVELRYFGGLTAEETAEVLGVSLKTVKRDWSVAKAWLYGELKEELPAT